MSTGLKIFAFFLGFFIYIITGIVLYIRYISPLTDQQDSWAVRIVVALVVLVIWAGLPILVGKRLTRRGKKKPRS